MVERGALRPRTLSELGPDEYYGSVRRWLWYVHDLGLHAPPSKEEVEELQHRLGYGEVHRTAFGPGTLALAMAALAVVLTPVYIYLPEQNLVPDTTTEITFAIVQGILVVLAAFGGWMAHRNALRVKEERQLWTQRVLRYLEAISSLPGEPEGRSYE